MAMPKKAETKEKAKEIEILIADEITEETIDELTDGKGDDDDE